MGGRRWLRRVLIALAVLLVLIVATPVVLVLTGVIAPSTVKLAWHALTQPEKHPDGVVGQLQLPDGFHASLYAANLAGARVLHVTPAGDLLVSRPRAGEVVLLERDHDGDGLPDGRRVLLRNLDLPHGLDTADGWLYVAEQTAVGRVRFDVASGRVAGEYRQIVTGLTGGGNHWSRTLRIGPDGLLYLTLGSTCNACEEKDPRRAAMMRFNADGSGGGIYASGLRNAVGFDWAPWPVDGRDDALFATDNGRDLLGDDFPPCELNRVVEGGFYGWPYANGYNVPDPDFGEGHEEQIEKSLPPVFGFRAHNAPLGMRFLRHALEGARLDHTALVALHGSWNRSVPDGYKVVALRWAADGDIVAEDFLSGFLRDGDVLGRPADVAEDARGVIYVSDDFNGAIYRIAYGNDVAANAPLPAATVTDSGLSQFSDEQRTTLRAQGEAIYQRYGCANCHEAGAARDGRPVRSLAKVGERYSVATLGAFFVAPTPPMPVFPLSEEERSALAVLLLERAGVH